MGIRLYVSLHSICLDVSGNTQPPQPGPSSRGVFQGFPIQKEAGLEQSIHTLNQLDLLTWALPKVLFSPSFTFLSA